MKKNSLFALVTLSVALNFYGLNSWGDGSSLGKVYWVGPYVFAKSSEMMIKKMQAVAKDHNFRLLPAGIIDSSTEDMNALYRENLVQMKSADFMIADISQFRGVSAENGTAFSMGFMYGLGKPVFAYSGDRLLFYDRIVADLVLHDRKVVETVDGRIRDDHGDSLEVFDMADNLMLHGAVEISHRIAGSGVLSTRNLPKNFEGALKDAKVFLAGRKVKFDPCAQQPLPDLPRTIAGRKKAVLNGPDVFRVEAKLLGLGKNIAVDQFSLNGKQLFTGVFPYDVAVIKNPTESNYQFGTRIFQKDVGNMCASDLSLANVVPYRGPGMDAGTAFEMGFMAAQNKPVFGYSNSKQDYATRVRDFFSKSAQNKGLSVQSKRDPKGFLIEKGTKETMMIEGVLRSSGYGIAPSLESALEHAGRFF